jgi:fumarate hydratase subunit alpha
LPFGELYINIIIAYNHTEEDCMKKITTEEISTAVEKLCIDSNYYLNSDIIKNLECGLAVEESNTGKEVLKQLLENATIAREEKMAICQDTGMAVIFIDIGQEVTIINGNLTDAINEGVRNGYQKGYLRKSVVSDPILRQNTGDNTPAVIHYNITDGDKLKITVAPKGFGSENMSSLKMLKPSDGLEGVKKFILETVSNAGPNPCPPIVVGVGIGGTMEKAAFLAKKALLRPVDECSPLPHIKELEEEMLANINKLGIGPAGLGGKVTALGLNIEVFPTHIAGLPVAVNISCHATRHAEIYL